MRKCTVKHKQIYVDCTRDQSHLTCIIHEPGHSPDECKVLNDFGANYA